jgi:hypothetical protein
MPYALSTSYRAPHGRAPPVAAPQTPKGLFREILDKAIMQAGRAGSAAKGTGPRTARDRRGAEKFTAMVGVGRFADESTSARQSSNPGDLNPNMRPILPITRRSIGRSHERRYV